jgi:hypothetical protein
MANIQAHQLAQRTTALRPPRRATGNDSTGLAVRRIRGARWFGGHFIHGTEEDADDRWPLPPSFFDRPDKTLGSGSVTFRFGGSVTLYDAVEPESGAMFCCWITAHGHRDNDEVTWEAWANAPAEPDSYDFYGELELFYATRCWVTRYNSVLRIWYSQLMYTEPVSLIPPQDVNGGGPSAEVIYAGEQNITLSVRAGLLSQYDQQEIMTGTWISPDYELALP